MKVKIALATVAGRAYYKLVKELKRRDLPFLSLKPWDPIPLDANVTITTSEEKDLISHPKALICEWESDPVKVIDKAIKLAQGKPSYDKAVVGVDPGKTYGVAVLGDDTVLETANCFSLQETLKMIIDSLKRISATVNIVKVGDSASIYTRELLHALDCHIPIGVIIEVVSESGTSHLMNENTAHRRGLRDIISALEIARRRGQVYFRRQMR